MVELVFFTSNRTKLAHLKHLGRGLGIRILGFREKSFYATYHEPKIDDRRLLLQESYRSALTLWKKWNGGNDYGYFIFEDTSVRIEALSKNAEIPGVNVKYWMQGMTFTELNKLIAENGGDRRAVVRSDIVLHVPEHLKQAIGLTDEFLWYSGETQGVVTEINERIHSDLLYPWLDSRSFNRWFIPSEFKVPFSKLSITDADSVDFRKRALQKVANFFVGIGLLDMQIHSPQIQLKLPGLPPSPPVIIICGFSCAGKTTLAQRLLEKFHFAHIEASDFMYQAFWQRHGLAAKAKIGNFAEAALKHEPSIVANAIAAHINAKKYPAVVVTGFRSPDELIGLETQLNPKRKIDLVFLEATEPIRLKRALNRGRDNVTAKRFHARDLQESRMGLLRIQKLPDAQILKNEQSLYALYRLFEQKYQPLLSELSQLDYRRFVSHERVLEDLILLALSTENQKGLTTTEIAELINKKFGQRKSKNNVSRYFNQEIHPYYDIAVVDRRIRYRLSSTGISEARTLAALGLPIYQRRVPRNSQLLLQDLFANRE